MGIGYRIAALVVVALMGLTFFAAFRGWGLRSTTDAEAMRRREHSVRTGSRSYIRRSHYGGGHRYGK
jgi:hypothetical protein